MKILFFSRKWNWNNRIDSGFYSKENSKLITALLLVFSSNIGLPGNFQLTKQKYHQMPRECVSLLRYLKITWYYFWYQSKVCTAGKRCGAPYRAILAMELLIVMLTLETLKHYKLFTLWGIRVEGIFSVFAENKTGEMKAHLKLWLIIWVLSIYVNFDYFLGFQMLRYRQF